MIRSLAAAFAFLTRMPLVGRLVRPEDLPRSVLFFPAVGAVLGWVMAVTAEQLTGVLAPQVIAVILVAELAAATGGLHLDGLADTVDGLSGGRGDRERMLAIMRDGRSGPHGVAAVVLVLLGKSAAIATLVVKGDPFSVGMAPIVARLMLIPVVVLVPYARAEGLGAAFRSVSRFESLATFALLLALVVSALDAQGRLGLALAALVVLGLVLHVMRRIGGATGDVYGASVELAEVVFLAAVARV